MTFFVFLHIQKYRHMIQRVLQQRIEKRIQQGKAVIILGARRVGKTVMLKEIVKGYQGRTLLLNGEDFDVQALFASQTSANYKQLLSGIDLLAIDEAQSIPDIGRKIKLIVDEIPSVAIIATGSSAFDLLNKTGEPLVGRSTHFSLYPFSLNEIASTENPLQLCQNLEKRLIYGCYPEVVLQEDHNINEEYLREVVNAYLLKDILAIDGIKNSNKMRDLLRLIAFQMGSKVSYDELANKLGISKNTVQKYLDLLSKVFVLFRLGGYARNLRKEVSKAGKWYFYDNGIRNAVIGRFQPLAIRDDVGALWENYFISERMKLNSNQGNAKSLYFWKTYDHQEIDLVEENGSELTTFEIKWTEQKAKLPVAFAKAYPNERFFTVNKENYSDFLNL